jgi:membrane peptidoglycan carboxypeptidase
MTQTGGIGERVISREAAAQLTYMMSRVVEEGTGKRARIDGLEIAGKTGTSQSARDAWFIAFTADYVMGIWMGYDDNTPLKDVTGGGLPADMWREAMVGIQSQLVPTPLPMIRPNFVPQFNGRTMTSGEPGFQVSPQNNRGGGQSVGGGVEDAYIGVLRSIFGQGN